MFVVCCLFAAVCGGRCNEVRSDGTRCFCMLVISELGSSVVRLSGGSSAQADVQAVLINLDRV